MKSANKEMTQEQKNEVEICKKEIQVIIFKLMQTIRPFGSLLNALNIIPDYDCLSGGKPTMATNGTEVLYHPRCIIDEGRKKAAAIILHELKHILFNDVCPKRCKAYPAVVDIGGEKVRLLNIAQDFALANVLMDIYEERNLSEVIEKPSKCMLYDEKYKGLRQEKIYYMLLEEARNNKNKKSKKKDKSNDSGNGSSASEGELKLDLDKIDKHMEGGEGNGDKNDVKSAVTSNRLKEMMRRELMQEKIRNKGKLPASLEQLSDLLFPVEKVDWRDLLSDYLEDSFKSIFMTIPPAKKYLPYDLVLPSVRGEHIRFFVAVDTSGSMSEYLKEIYCIIQSSFQKFDSYDVTLIEADCSVEKVIKYGMGEDFESTKPSASGGGGTSFIPAYNYVEEELSNSYSKSVMIYITDGWGDFPKNESSNFDMIWIAPEGTLDPSEFPFGKVVVYTPG